MLKDVADHVGKSSEDTYNNLSKDLTLTKRNLESQIQQYNDLQAQYQLQQSQAADLARRF